MVDRKQYVKDRQQVRNYILDKQTWKYLLSSRTRLLAELIIKFPVVLHVVYPLYVTFLQKRKYD